MKTTTAIICAGGAGTRLLPATKEQPKEMLPLFAPCVHGTLTLKPIAQLIFEQLYDAGIRDFCFVIGRGKRAIEDHFTEDKEFLSNLGGSGVSLTVKSRTTGLSFQITPRKSVQDQLVSDLEDFYRRLSDSNLTWVNQPSPGGFGQAVLAARNVIGDRPFLVHAGDTYIMSDNNSHLQQLIMAFEDENSEAVFLLKYMGDVRERGVAQTTKIGDNLYKVVKVEEKPEHPTSHLGIEPVYLFRLSIFDCLHKLGPGKGFEVQLTDAIQLVVESGKKVLATCLADSDLRLDIGNPESYWDALQQSYQASHRILGTVKN